MNYWDIDEMDAHAQRRHDADKLEWIEAARELGERSPVDFEPCSFRRILGAVFTKNKSTDNEESFFFSKEDIEAVYDGACLNTQCEAFFDRRDALLESVMEALAEYDSHQEVRPLISQRTVDYANKGIDIKINESSYIIRQNLRTSERFGPRSWGYAGGTRGHILG